MPSAKCCSQKAELPQKFNFFMAAARDRSKSFNFTEKNQQATVTDAALESHLYRVS